MAEEWQGLSRHCSAELKKLSWNNFTECGKVVEIGEL
jgi:hypothetical protein